MAATATALRVQRLWRGPGQTCALRDMADGLIRSPIQKPGGFSRPENINSSNQWGAKDKARIVPVCAYQIIHLNDSIQGLRHGNTGFNMRLNGVFLAKRRIAEGKPVVLCQQVSQQGAPDFSRRQAARCHPCR